jgi:hypothetical protein
MCTAAGGGSVESPLKIPRPGLGMTKPRLVASIGYRYLSKTAELGFVIPSHTARDLQRNFPHVETRISRKLFCTLGTQA